MARTILALCLMALLCAFNASAQTATPAATATATPTATPTPPANAGSYPATLMDSPCTDSYNVPAAQTGGSIGPAAQTSGTGDGFCDHDSRIVSAAQTANEVFGPFRFGPTSTGIIVFVDADTVSNDTDTWQIDILMVKPDNASTMVLGSSAEQSTEDAFSFGFLPALQSADSGAGADTDVSMQDWFYIRLTLGTATSWAGSISWREF